MHKTMIIFVTLFQIKHLYMYQQYELCHKASFNLYVGFSTINIQEGDKLANPGVTVTQRYPLHQVSAYFYGGY